MMIFWAEDLLSWAMGSENFVWSIRFSPEEKKKKSGGFSTQNLTKIIKTA